MSWYNEMVRIVRFLVNDLDASTYDDTRLEETIVVAAQLVCSGVDFDKTYTIDIDTLVLTPDPTAPPKDDWFINLVCIKAGCIILGSEVKTLAAQSYRVSDGPASIDISGAYKATKELYTELCQKYDIEVMRYRAGDSIAGQVVTTPYTQERINAGNPIRNIT